MNKEHKKLLGSNCPHCGKCALNTIKEALGGCRNSLLNCPHCTNVFYAHSSADVGLYTQIADFSTADLFNTMKKVKNTKQASTTEPLKSMPYKTKSGPVAYFDVDDTLLMWKDLEPSDTTVTTECRGRLDICAVNTHNVALLKNLAKRGYSIVVWTLAGSDWAEAVVKALELEEFVDIVTEKPTIYVDDRKDPRDWIGKYGYYKSNGERVDDFTTEGNE